MVRIVLSLFCTNESSGSTTVVAVGDVESRHLSELLSDYVDVSLITNNPELMTEAVVGSNEVVLWLCCCVALDERVEHLVVRISEEHRLDVGVVYANMLHAVFLLVAACQLVLLDCAVEIVVDESTHNKSVLSLAVHCLSIDIIVLVCVLTKPTLLLEHLEVSGSLLVNARIVLACARFEVNLRLDDMIKTLLVIACLCSCLFTIEHVVRT